MLTNLIKDFDVLLTVHLSVFISVINQLDAQNFCFTVSFISCLYMFRAHVLIIRRSKLHYTASGIITPIGGRLVCRLRAVTVQNRTHVYMKFFYHKGLGNHLLQ